MKAIIISMLVSLCYPCYAQHIATGLYLTVDDFNNGRLCCTAVPHQRHSIHLHDILYTPFITVINGSTRTSYSKDSVYGYRTRNNTAFRLYRREAFEVLNVGSCPVLYRQTFMRNSKESRPAVIYYFSKDESSPIEDLSRENLSRAFTADTAFIEHMYSVFNSDNDLAAYDSYHKTYRIAWIYQYHQSIKHDHE